MSENGCVTLSDMVGEITDMLRVCFEGEVAEMQDFAVLRLPDGQSFRIYCEKLSLDNSVSVSYNKRTKKGTGNEQRKKSAVERKKQRDGFAQRSDGLLYYGSVCPLGNGGSGSHG